MKLLLHSISLLRFGFAVSLVWGLKGQPLSVLVLLLSLLVLGSDMIDGWLARQYHLESVVGSWIDFLCDVSWLLAWFYFWNLSHAVIFSLVLFGLVYVVSSRFVRTKPESFVKDVLGRTLCAFLMAWPIVHYATSLLGFDMTQLFQSLILIIILIACLNRLVLLVTRIISRSIADAPVYHVWDDFTTL